MIPMNATLLTSALVLLASRLAAGAAAPAPREILLEGPMGIITRLPDGRMFSATIQGRPANKWNDLSVTQRVSGRYSSDAGLHWTEPRFLFEPQGPGTANPPIPLATSDGAIHIFYLQLINLDTPRDWNQVSDAVWHGVSRDGGKSWQPPRKIDYGARYTGALLSVVELKSGRILLPVSQMMPERASGLFVAATVYSDDGGETWHRSKNSASVDSGGRLLESGAIEPAVVELADGRIWMVFRTQTGYLFESYSQDQGETWSPARR